jgi:hypothetical protein
MGGNKIENLPIVSEAALSHYYMSGNNWQWSSWKSASWFAGKLSDFASFNICTVEYSLELWYSLKLPYFSLKLR